jgi:hypothetical protein
MIGRCAVLVTLFVLCAGGAALGAEAAELFATDEILVMEISFDMQHLCRNPNEEECPDLPAVVSYRDGDERGHTIESLLRIRGRWKAHTADCSLPALFLVLAPTATQGTVFEQQEALPLTTHCRRSRNYEQYALKEYLAHRIYNTLTEKSLKARLARITYHDLSGRTRSIERYGFFTEHFQSLADRSAAEVWNPEASFDLMSADSFELVTLSVFQYMIGNTDWSVIAGHNIMYLRGTGWVTPVPFDLDYSGLVSAGYASPPPELDLRNVRQRLYRGICRPNADWPAIFEHFLSRRAEILELAAEIPGLSRYHRRRAAAYLEDFFEIVETSEQRERRIIASCRNP